MTAPVPLRRVSRQLYPQQQSATTGTEVDAVSGLADLPQAFADEPAHVIGKRRRQNLQSSAGASSSRSNSIAWVLPFGLLMIGVLVGAYILTSYHEQAVLDQMRKDVKDEEETLMKDFEEKNGMLQQENKVLQSQIEEAQKLKIEIELLREEGGHARKLRQNLEHQIDYLKKYKTQMQENIQLMSKTALLEKFGPGPHRVEILLQFDPDFPKLTSSDQDVASIVIELAPVDELPHVVYWFLEQVSRGLYDGCSFHRNAGHVVQGGPTPNFLSPPNPQLQKRFGDARFVSVLFQEYSANFPHKKYTLGFAGRPGGPDFYISTMDNTVNHGPGGQTSYEDPSEADPCFAKVVDGFSVVDRVALSPVKPGWYKAMVQNVAIRSMRIISKDNVDADEGKNRPIEDVPQD